MATETDALLRAVDKTLGVRQAAHQIECATLPKMESFLRELDELLHFQVYCYNGLYQ